MIKSCDTEATGLNMFHGHEPFAIGIMDEEGGFFSREWSVDPLTRKVLYTQEKLDEICHQLEGHSVVFHHAKFDLRALSTAGIIIHSRFPDFTFNQPRNIPCLSCRVVEVEEIHDTQFLSHCTYSLGADGHALKPLAFYHLDYTQDDEKDLRKAVIKARAIGKKLGWKLGVDLHGEREPYMDYWMPAACYEWANQGRVWTDKFLKIAESIPADWVDICLRYLKGDVHRTIGLFFYFQEILDREGLRANYEREIRLLPVTYMMEHSGMHVHKSGLETTLQEFDTSSTTNKSRAEKLLCETANLKNLNANSGEQLASALIASGIPLSVRTAPSSKHPEGQWATDAETMRSVAQYVESQLNLPHGPLNPENVGGSGTRLRSVVEALRLLFGYHPDSGDDLDNPIPGYKTFKTGVSYCNNYRDLLDSYSLLHPSYLQVGTAWTRYACTEPNSQNISKKAVLPLRKMFGPPPGYIWLAIDYSQLELRIYAYASNDRGLIKAFEDGFDFHTFSAMEMYGIPADQITSEQRRAAKAVNFGIIFGSGPRKVDLSSGRPGTYATYMAKFPNAKAYIARVSALVESTGYVTTLDGYRLYVPADKPYAGVNGIVQGTAGSIMKRAMIALHTKQLVDWAPPCGSFPYGGSSIVANIHDELIIQLPLSYPWRAIGKRIMEEMEEAGKQLGVITPVDCKVIRTNWAAGEKFNV